MAWHGTVWYGTVWYDMLWYGMVWYKPENKFQWFPDKVSGTSRMVPDTDHFVPDIKLQ